MGRVQPFVIGSGRPIPVLQSEEVTGRLKVDSGPGPACRIRNHAAAQVAKIFRAQTAGFQFLLQPEPDLFSQQKL